MIRLWPWWPWGDKGSPTPEAEQARLRAERALEESIKQRDEAVTVSSSLRELRETNHFGQRVEGLWMERLRERLETS
jgi:hypothetical protein